jgi:hypothetical protein
LLRGDAGFGNEPIMREAEQRGMAYLFKLRLTSNVEVDRKAIDAKRVDQRGSGVRGQG